MKNSNPSGNQLRFANTRQRLLSLFMLAVFAALIWLAVSGRFDAMFYGLASWLGSSYDALTR